jgi:hypothetical protein
MGARRFGGRLAGGLLEVLGRLARRGDAAAVPHPDRPRRLLLLQIDGLSSERLAQALACGRMPRLARRLRAGQFRWRALTALSAPSTPVFQAGLLYGHHGEVPGFGWYDRRLGRDVRMDLGEDVEAVQRELDRRSPGLLDGGVSYGTIFTGRARDTFFNVVRWARPEATPDERRPLGPRNAWDVLASAAMLGAVSGRLFGPLLAELGAGLRDLWRFFRRQRTTRFEWRFLYMRLFTSVVLREIGTSGLILDVLRGVPVLYADYFGYDECAHRRGPDSGLALCNLGGVDEDLERVLRAVERVPEYGYDVYVFSDHGQSASIPFERVEGEPLAVRVLRLCARADGGDEALLAAAIRALVRLRSGRLWARAQRRVVRALLEPQLAWLERQAEAEIRLVTGRPLHRLRVVTGGTIAHVYVGRRGAALRLDEIEALWPRLVDGLARSRGVGLVLARGPRGPIVIRGGHRRHLDERAELESLPPFRALGYELLREHLRAALASDRAGDLVLFGAFAPSGDVAFDFELGSHGGIHPEELSHFLLHPSDVELPFGDTVRADELYRFFHAAYGARRPARAPPDGETGDPLNEPAPPPPPRKGASR